MGTVNIYCDPKALEVNGYQLVDSVFYFVPLEDDVKLKFKSVVFCLHNINYEEVKISLLE